MSLFLVILAAGKGKRVGSNTPKSYIKVNNKTLLEHSIDRFKNFKEIKRTIVVYNKKHIKLINKLKLKNIIKIRGGNTRQQSTFAALKRLKKMNCKKVLIHDSARPNTSEKIINKIIFKLKKNHSVVPIIKINDATKRIKENIIFKNISRNSLRFSQTPQGFLFKKIYDKHQKSKNKNFDDDASLFADDNEKIVTVSGSKKNFKITDNEDFEIFKNFNNKKIGYGIGFDIHKLVKGRKLYLGGIKIPFRLGLKGHSDGDSVLHSLIDALLGACKLGNIGKLFSDKNKKYKNIRSIKLLEKTIDLIKLKNFSINNIDINIIAEKPKIKKYENKMITLISKLCRINPNQINIKGKTTEKLGLIGKEKAIASEAIVSVIKHD